MKNSYFAALGKNPISRPLLGVVSTVFCVAASMVVNSCLADTYPLRVVYAEVPGTAEVESGRIELGIALLQAELGKADPNDRGDILTTLCAAYIVARAFDDARYPCNKAVEIGATYAALNNRGVFRAFTGDLAGARQDLDRARPEQLEAYIVELTTKDARIVASGNFELISDLVSKVHGEDIDSSVADNSAAIEEINEFVSR